MVNSGIVWWQNDRHVALALAECYFFCLGCGYNGRGFFSRYEGCFLFCLQMLSSVCLLLALCVVGGVRGVALVTASNPCVYKGSNYTLDLRDFIKFP